jgi:restriction system protein
VGFVTLLRNIRGPGRLFLSALVQLAQENPWESGLIVAALIFAIEATIILCVRKFIRRRRALRLITLENIDGMTGAEFENYMVHVFQGNGYRVKHTGHTGDMGCDLILTKNGEKIACQLKCYSGPVPPDAVREAVTAVKLYSCRRSMVATNNSFTISARKRAAANQCELIDREQLGELIARFKANRSNWLW